MADLPIIPLDRTPGGPDTAPPCQHTTWACPGSCQHGARPVHVWLIMSYHWTPVVGVGHPGVKHKSYGPWLAHHPNSHLLQT